MESCPPAAAQPASSRKIHCFALIGWKLKAKNGMAQTQVNAEKNITISGPRSPLRLICRTNVYAAPAPRPPSTPASEGRLAMPAVGRTTNTAPINAARTLRMSTFFGYSRRMSMEKRMAKNGESLLSILASAMPM